LKKQKNVFADLHTHSTASDGLLTPTQLVESAQEKGLSVLAITDHDTVGGLAEAFQAAQRSGIKLVPGIELSCVDCSLMAASAPVFLLMVLSRQRRYLN